MTNISESALIAEVQKHQVLYDKAHPQYKKNHIREASWEQIGNALESDSEKCKKRWRTLRDTFIKSRKQEKLLRKGKNWHLQDQMQFLVPYLEMTRVEGDHEIFSWQSWQKDSGEDYGEAEEDEYPIKVSASPSSPLSTSSVKSKGEDQQSMFIPSIEMSCSSKRLADTSTSNIRKKHKSFGTETQGFTINPDFWSQPQDPDILFMLSQVDSLKKLTPRNNRFAKIKIQQLLYDLEFGGDNFSSGTKVTSDGSRSSEGN